MTIILIGIVVVIVIVIIILLKKDTDNTYISVLGRSSWFLLHSISEKYSENPSYQEQELMRSFIISFAKFYPCKKCSINFQKYIKNNPPNVNSNIELQKWFYDAHNDVNIRLGKPIYKLH